MRGRSKLLSIASSVQFVLLCVFAFGGASFVNPRAPIVDQAAETTRVKGVVDQFFSAAKKRDWDAAGALMSQDFEVYTDGASGFDKQAYVKILKEDDMELASMELSDMEIHVSVDGQMAWAKYRGLFKATSHNQPSTTQTAETLIFKKEAGQWKITRGHVSIKTLNPK